ncbi:hypothetical protein Pla144_34350 [Bythopirellula polymerisocia]|uniref:Uncharacterized protein n=1 Tax=Bythopirellula polymerisocia TaxID=2528003 RepID=A0A5C6CMJ6_9BACT|nr:hypothetical protein Pla144_34350 [Bythopirellula polymerisocia]
MFQGAPPSWVKSSGALRQTEKLSPALCGMAIRDAGTRVG